LKGTVACALPGRRPRPRGRLGPICLSAALVAHNNLLNLWGPFSRTYYLPVNLTLAGALALASRGLGLGAESLGLSGSPVRGAIVGAGAGAVAASPLFLCAASPRCAIRIADARVAGLHGGRLLYEVLVRIPFGTALVEEWAFRGVLLAAWGEPEEIRAALVSSAVFGLWHITPTVTLVRVNKPDAGRPARVLAVAGAVAGTAAGGLFLARLRTRTRTIASPLALHAAVNGLATIAAALAHRRVREPARASTHCR
jgi:uncharacterized protein